MDLTVITANVSADFLAPPGVPPWEARKTRFAATLRASAPAVIGLQEVTPRQLAFLQAQWPDYTALTVPVTDPDPALQAAWRAKYAAYGLPEVPSPYEIVSFYRTADWEVASDGLWWLSPTPERPSIGFGNTAPRVVRWAQLRARAGGRAVIVLNTHLDHRCPRPMVDLCLERFEALIARGRPLIFLGDLNFNPADAEYARLREAGWHDAHAAAAEADQATFLYDLPGIPGGRIDHVLYRGAGLTPRAWARLQPPHGEPRWSDHDPVLARFTLD